MILEKEWMTEAGYPARCAINGFYPEHIGFRCGYVGLSKSHILHGTQYNRQVIGMEKETTLNEILEVHGGVTFSDYLDASNGQDPGSGMEDLWWIGFDCIHSGDGLIEKSNMGVSYEVGNGNGKIRSQDFVKAECESLAEQIEEIRYDLFLLITEKLKKG